MSELWEAVVSLLGRRPTDRLNAARLADDAWGLGLISDGERAGLMAWIWDNI